MKHRKIRPDMLRLILPIVAVILCAVAAICSPKGIIRSEPAAVPREKLTFLGEYSCDGRTWETLTDETDIAIRDGELYLRGQFSGDIPQGAMLNFYTDHIGVALYVNGELWNLDAVSEFTGMGMGLSPAFCGRGWQQVCSPGITPRDHVEIRLCNPHAYGNRDACRYFLNTLCSVGSAGDPYVLRDVLKPYGNPMRVVAVFLGVAAMMLLGAAFAALALRTGNCGKLLSAGMLFLSAAGFMAFDTVDTSLWSENVTANTYVCQLSMMLFACCLGCYLVGELSGGRKKAAGMAVNLSVGLTVVLLVAVAAGGVLLYDTMMVWAVSQLAVLPVLLVCWVGELWAVGRERGHRLVSAGLLCVTLLLDLCGVGESILSRGTCTKIVFVLVTIVHLAAATQDILENYQASALAERLRQEVENSRTAIMLSQIKPHFLHNSLGVIQELCHTEPLAAEDAIGNFAKYLRGNMSALESDELIPFKKELEHAKCYLEIEKLRFGDQLKVEIFEQDVYFRLPALTIQPLVENAVRHGARKREDGGTVTVSAAEYPDRYEVVIRDNGPGFDVTASRQDGKMHIGITNVRERLQRMCGGDLRIESAPGQGTKAIIILPKGAEQC